MPIPDYPIFDDRDYNWRLSVAAPEGDEFVDVLDCRGAELGLRISLREVHRLGLVHRTVDLFIIAPDGRLVLQHRAGRSDPFAGSLGPTAGGHLHPGESLHDGILREAHEEIGCRFLKKERLVMLLPHLPWVPLYYTRFAIAYDGAVAWCVRHGRQKECQITITGGSEESAVVHMARDLARIQPWCMPARHPAGGVIDRMLFNQECCCFFAAWASWDEIASLLPDRQEVSQIDLMSLEAFARSTTALGGLTDTVDCLHRNGLFADLSGLIGTEVRHDYR